MQQNQGNVRRRRKNRKFKKPGGNKNSPVLHRRDENMTLEECIKFYKDVFDIDVKSVIEKLEIPERVDEHINTPLLINADVGFLDKVLRVSGEYFDVQYEGLRHKDCNLCQACRESIAGSILFNHRGDDNKPYIILVEESGAPNMEYADYSVSNINKGFTDGIKGMTLMERLVFGLWMRWKHAMDIDVSTTTLCSGTYVEHEVEGFRDSFAVSYGESEILLIKHVSTRGWRKSSAPRLITALPIA